MTDIPYKIGNYYEILHKINQGSFGIVYKAIDRKKNEIVCVKIESKVSTLKHEVRVLQYLSNHGVKNIPKIYTFGTLSHNQYFIMPFYEFSLTDFVCQKGVRLLPILYSKLFRLLESIHDQYVVHRDIKPQNFMIKDGNIILIDFGMATYYVDENMHHRPNITTDSIIGTPKYTSLFIHKGNTYSRRDDLVALMYMYFFLYTKTLPYDEILHLQQHLSIIHSTNVFMTEKKDYTTFETFYTQMTEYKTNNDFQNHIDFGLTILKNVLELEYDDRPIYIV